MSEKIDVRKEEKFFREMHETAEGLGWGWDEECGYRPNPVIVLTRKTPLEDFRMEVGFDWDNSVTTLKRNLKAAVKGFNANSHVEEKIFHNVYNGISSKHTVREYADDADAIKLALVELGMALETILKAA